MNIWPLALIRALRGHRWLRFLGGAYILSSSGNGFTQIIIFGQLLQWQASPATLTIVYRLSMLSVNQARSSAIFHGCGDARTMTINYQNMGFPFSLKNVKSPRSFSSYYRGC
ncbi:hypothetical protein [Cronobacter condimenti]|uniref:hypothetical protein n=1 Tax=Cronobacter condimenti TaxID=1163710 RepID=UPI002A91322B|nr:hypothetical protein [Cronobacter condimenti]